MTTRTEAEQEAIDIHESIVADYERAIANGKVDKDGCRRRVTDHLLETGGGLTLAEIEADLTATKGELWSPRTLQRWRHRCRGHPGVSESAGHSSEAN